MDITGIVNVYDGNGDEIPTYTAGVGTPSKIYIFFFDLKI